MRKISPMTLLCVWALCALVHTPRATADDSPGTASPTSLTVSPDFCKLVNEITETILENHIDPPARQQMILGGLKGAYQAAGVPVPFGLSRRVSAQTTGEHLVELLTGVWPKSSANGLSSKDLEGRFLDGLLLSVPGEAELISAKDRKVAEQIAGNRYVGIHIALSTDDERQRPRIAVVWKGGPADKAGVKADDVLEQVDGFDTKGVALRDVIDRLRGDDGTDVTIVVRQPKEQKSRTIKMTRGQLPRETVRGISKTPAGQWKTRLDGPGAVGFVRIGEISASTPHELRKLVPLLESEGVQSVVIDLRGLDGESTIDSTHAAVLLADCLLERGTIGRVRTAKGVQTYQAEADAVFRGRPMAVLVDGFTSGTAEWLAAALQDNHRAILFGAPTQGSSGRMSACVRSPVAVGDGPWSISLVTGSLERGDGRPLGGVVFSPQASVPRGRVLRRGPPGPAQSSRMGVKPDHLVGPPDQRGSVDTTADDYNVAADVVLKKAAEHLRAAPDKT
jgi:carboxyl-terminal processing protease